MHKETADELLLREDNGAFRITGTFSPCREGNGFIVHGKDAAVGDGDPVRITAEVIDGVSKAVEGLLDIRAPVLMVEGVTELIPGIRVSKNLTGLRKSKASIFIELVEAGEKLAPELVAEDMDRDKERAFGKAELPVGSDAAAGNDAVHVDVVVKLLVPGVEDLDDARDCPEELPAGSKLEEGLGSAAVEHGIKELLIAEDQGIELMRQGEDHMEVRRTDDLGAAFVCPDLIGDSLAVGAVAVAAGIVVDPGKAAVVTDRPVGAKTA